MNLSSNWASIWTLAVLALAASACGTSPTEPAMTVFEDVTWKLESLTYADGASVKIEDPDAFTALFGTDELLHARADCNVCNGSYGSDGSSISVGAMGCTRAYCFSAPLDTDYVGLLQAARTVTATEHELLLRGPDGTLTFRR